MAKSKLKSEDLMLNIIVNGNKAQSDIAKLGREIQDAKTKTRDLERQQKELEKQGKRDSDAYRQLTAEINKNNQAIDQNRQKLAALNQSLKLEEQTEKQLEAQLKNIIRLRKEAVPDSAPYKAYSDQIEAIKNRLAELRNGAKETDSAFERLSNGFQKYFAIMTGAIASFIASLSSIKKAVEDYAAFDDVLASVQKTTGLTKTAVKELNKELTEIETRTSQEDLLGLGRIGGKLGINELDDLAGFVRATNQIVVALNEDLGGNVEETVNQLGKLVDIFGLKEVYGMEDALLKVGSAINELGANSTASEAYLVDFTNRMAGIAPITGLTIDQILGLGATLDQFGQSSEVSTTALSKLFIKMAQEADKYSRYAGMSVTEFKDLLEKDFMAAFQRVLEGVRGNANGINELAASLGDLGVDGGRVVAVLGTLANNTDALRTQLDLASVSLREGTSITKEYNTMNETAAAELDKKKKEVKALWVELGERLWPAYTTGLGVLSSFIQAVKTIIGFVAENRKVIITLTTAIVSYYATVRLMQAYRFAVIALSFAYETLFGSATRAAAAQKLNNTAAAAGQVIVTAYRVVVLSFAVAYNVLTGNMARAAAAQRLLNATMLANPVGIVVAAVAALSTAIYLYTRRATEAERVTKLLADANGEVEKAVSAERSELERNTKAISDNTLTRDEKLTAVKNLRALMPDVLQDYTNEEILAGKATEAIARQTEALLLQAKVRAGQGVLAKRYEERAELVERRRQGLAGASMWERLTAGFRATNGKSTAQAYEEMLDEQIKIIDEANDVFGEEVLKSQAKLNAMLVKRPDPLVVGSVTPSGDGSDSKANKARLKALEEEQKNYNERLKAANLFRENLSELTDQQLQQLLALQKQHQTKMDEINKQFGHSEKTITLTAQVEIDKRAKAYETEQNRIIASQKSTIEQENDAHQLRLEKAGLAGKQREDLTAHQLKVLEILEQTHQANLNKLDAQAMKKEIEERQQNFQNELSEMRIRNNEELSQVKTLADAKLKLEGSVSPKVLQQVKTLQEARKLLNKKYQQEENELTKKNLEALLSDLQTVLDTGEWKGIDLSDKIISDEEKKGLMDKVTEIKKILAGLLLESLPGKEENDYGNMDILGMTKDQWLGLFKNLDDTKRTFLEVMAVAQSFQQLWGQYNQMVSAGEKRALQEFEQATQKKKDALQAQLDSGRISQEAYNKRVEKLDKDLDKRRAQMEYNQAKRDRALAIASAITNTAVAVTKALPNLFLAALVGSMGALQLATILKTPLPAVPGREEGGFAVQREQDGKVFNARRSRKRMGMINRPSILVAENGREFVLSNQAVENPELRPLISVIDTAQRNGTISTIGMEDVMAQTMANRTMQGRASGGTYSGDPVSSGSSTTGSVNPYEATNELLRKNLEATDRLNETIKRGITAEVAILGKNGFREKMNELTAIEKDANI
ncbi:MULTISPECIES: phage tail tape measure protein [Olivibacter]|uniref:Phage tail tape measure protein n=1 Tax=Olivibacter jilunii TaxID=985016 RepID=A0ABW6B0D2_9SPHI